MTQCAMPENTLNKGFLDDGEQYVTHQTTHQTTTTNKNINNNKEKDMRKLRKVRLIAILKIVV